MFCGLTTPDPLALYWLAKNVTAAVADTTLLATNKLRIGASFYNDSTSACYLKFGTGASATSFTVKMSAGSLYEIFTKSYNGQVNCYWVSANGSMRITEIQ
jgi:hypothetical protein